MTFQQRISMMGEYRNLAERLLSEGQTAAAGEMLWGTVHNVIQAIGIQHNLLGDRNEVRRAVVMHNLIDSHGYSIFLLNQLSAAGELHGHFYNRNVAESRLLMELIPTTQQYIDTLVSIAGTP
ncbi:MAG: hypothetical protein F4X64_01585 [Chloroflexi bacterium]|nr:hypothetical protein [Chloroflexota bacterium]